mmetsp:Transcript_4512/g.20530  ORF Transcript_4512/g.20530 Transcript_4512/m.20530 type:complete len:214 (+) Transcript_4512:1109-1750(+)
MLLELRGFPGEHVAPSLRRRQALAKLPLSRDSLHVPLLQQRAFLHERPLGVVSLLPSLRQFARQVLRLPPHARQARLGLVGSRRFLVRRFPHRVVLHPQRGAADLLVGELLRPTVQMRGFLLEPFLQRVRPAPRLTRHRALSLQEPVGRAELLILGAHGALHHAGHVVHLLLRQVGGLGELLGDRRDGARERGLTEPALAFLPRRARRGGVGG